MRRAVRHRPMVLFISILKNEDASVDADAMAAAAFGWQLNTETWQLDKNFNAIYSPAVSYRRPA